MKKVEWQEEWGELVPVCPYCNEMAYEKTHCVFCKGTYEWVEPKNVPELTVVHHKGFTIIQAADDHLLVYKDNRLKLHASCVKRLTEDELREEVDKFIDNRRDL
jgi:hypothetical protein